MYHEICQYNCSVFLCTFSSFCVFHHTAAPVRVEALVEPPDADTLVACYTDLNCVTFDAPISQTIRDCCLNNAQGRAYSAFGSELCVPCEGKHKINHVKNRSNIH